MKKLKQTTANLNFSNRIVSRALEFLLCSLWLVYVFAIHGESKS